MGTCPSELFDPGNVHRSLLRRAPILAASKRKTMRSRPATLVLLALPLLCGLATPAAQGPGSIVVRFEEDDSAPRTLRVAGPRYRELPGEAAIALEAPWETIVEHQVEAEARFFKAPAPHAGPFVVEASDERGRRARIFPVMAGQVGALRLARWPEETGLVIDDEGRRVAGARVGTGGYSMLDYTFSEQLLAPLPREAVTDQDGRYVLPADPDDLGWFTGGKGRFAWTDEHRSTARFYVVPGTRQVDDPLLLTAPRQLTGRVVCAGQPVAGAVVRALAPGAAEAVTDADGRFVVDAHRTLRIVVHAEGCCSTILSLSNDPANDFAAQVELPPGQAARFQVLLQGEPLADRRVVMTARSSTGAPGIGWVERTDAEGFVHTARLPAAAGLTAHVETDDGFLPVVATRVVQRPAGPPQDLGAFEVARPGRLSGQLLDAKGAPLVGARVLWRPKGPGYDCPLAFRVTFTDHGGRFHFERVLRDVGLLGVVSDPAGATSYEVDAREEITDLGELSMPVGGSAGGTVVDAQGQPLGGAHVQYILMFASADAGNRDAAFGRVYLHARTDADGAFHFRGLPRHSSATVWALHVGADGMPAKGHDTSSSSQGADGIEVTVTPYGGLWRF